MKLSGLLLFLSLNALAVDYSQTTSLNLNLKKHNEQHIVIAPESAIDDRILTGRVVDKDGLPIAGASVFVKNSAFGTTSDTDGKYSLKVSDPNSIIRISYLGFIAQEYKLEDRKVLDITLLEDVQMMDEIVVVGYGVQQKVNLSGAVSQLDSKVLANRPISNISSGIQGMLPGVIVASGQGRPGQDQSTIRVRGVGTLNSSNPYILIDGIESGSMNQIDPNDIETISVLKDASSAAIYGSKASNGVILITTKRGKSGKPQISYNGYVGVSTPTAMIDRISSADYATLYNKALVENGKARRFSDTDIEKFSDGSDPYGHPNTDWYDLAYQNGIQHQDNVNIRGGSENMSYMASAGYLYQTGILPHSDRQQFTGRTNLDIKLSKKLNVKMSMAYIKNDYKDPNSSYAGGSSDQIIRQLNIISPWIPYKNEDGSYGTISDGNPVAWLDLDQTVDRYNQNFTGILSVDYEIIPGLKATLQGGYVSNNQHYKAFRKFIQYNPSKASDPNMLDERYYLWERTNLDALLNYDKSFGEHNFKGLLGWHTEKYNYAENTMSRQKFPNNDLTDMNAGDASTQLNSGYTRELAMLSWFGRINYDYNGKYLLEGNIRADASSRFAPDNRWGYFPSFSAAWRLTEESFMESSREWLNNLKLRASWGLLGNQDALDDYYPWLNTYNIDKDGAYPFGGTLETGYYQKGYRISTISWEKARTIGFGLDLSVLNKINASIDLYDRKTTDIIMSVPVPSEFGLDAYKDNVGAMLNRGVELSLSYNNKWEDWSFGATGTFTYNKNEILDLGGVDFMTNPDNSNMRHQVGQAISSYYMYKANGFFQSDEEAQAYMDKYKGKSGYPFSQNFKAGDIIYEDTDGDGLINASDRVICNSTNPVYTFGLNLNAGYKGFDLSMIFSGAAKVARLYNNEAFGDFKGDNSHPSTIWLDAWTPENKDAKMPRIFEGTTSNSHPANVMSTFWLQNTSFMRLKNLQLGYTFPSSVLKSIGVSNLRIYYSVENLLTFDKMPINLDPESTVERGSAYPLIQTHSFGLNLTF